MNEPLAIHCENVCKSYRIRSGHGGFASRLRFWNPRRDDINFEALRAISFEVPTGNSLALIGPNGSGKSTLLRILCGITQPSSGRISVNGRIGAILELGGNFHPNLTGYENIFQTAAVLGVPRADIRKRLNAIEDFCELGDFLAAPTRTYSMGMLLRLAFAIEINLEPDILIIDEALAVGDGYFQKKCARWLMGFRESGRTLLFVSHMSELSESICDQAVWIDKGQLRLGGTVGEVSKAYHDHVFRDLLTGYPRHDQAALSSLVPQARYGRGGGRMYDVAIVDEKGAARSFFYEGEAFSINFQLASDNIEGEVAIYFILELPGQPVFFYDSHDRGKTVVLNRGETQSVALTIPGSLLLAGIYYVTLAFGRAGKHEVMYDCHQKVYHFSVRPAVAEKRFGLGFLHLDGTVAHCAEL